MIDLWGGSFVWDIEKITQTLDSVFEREAVVVLDEFNLIAAFVAGEAVERMSVDLTGCCFLIMERTGDEAPAHGKTTRRGDITHRDLL